MKKILPVLVIGVLLLAVGLVAAQGGLPGSGWLSGQQIQNVGAGTAKVSFMAYNLTGNPFNCGDRDVPAGGSTTYQTSTDCPVPAGFVGSAVVSADQPIAAIVNVSNVGTGEANGQYQGTDGADVDKTIVFPLVKHNHVNRTTTFYVQNASSGPNNISAKYVMRDGNEYTKTYNNVPANAMVVVSPGDANVPGGNGQVGALTITGSQALAGSALEHEHNAGVALNLQASKGFTPNDFSTEAYCPLYRSQHAAQQNSTGVQVQNVSNAQQQITLTFTPRGGGAPIVKTDTADPGESVTFYAPNLGFAPGTIGSAVVSSAGDLVAVTNETSEGGRKQTTYACFSGDSATTTISIPLAKEHFLGNTTGIQIQNVGGSAATNIQLVYQDTKGPGTVTVKNAAPVPAGSSFTANEVSNNPSTITVVSGNLASIDGKNNSVVITADQPIVAIANEISYAGGGKNQDNKNYEGFNQ